MQDIRVIIDMTHPGGFVSAEDAKRLLDNHDTLLKELQTIARNLYRDGCWQSLPWGTKQMLLKYVDKETIENWGKP